VPQVGVVHTYSIRRSLNDGRMPVRRNNALRTDKVQRAQRAADHVASLKIVSCQTSRNLSQVRLHEEDRQGCSLWSVKS
jgi:hypothetical protein